ncbi:MAG: glycosyltransferase [Isosphaeraceae bacterium]
MLFLILFCLVAALAPALLFWANLRLYTPPPCPDPRRTLPAVSVLIPARNEEKAIAAALTSALENEGTDLEVVVLDDQSDDRTAAIVEEMAAADHRLRLVRSPELPDGWCGKPHACWLLAREARHPLLLFLDADVRLARDAIARMATFISDIGADLASGIPRQQTVGILETLLIPLIHFVLLGFLPLHRMRQDPRPSLGAGCGQLFIVRSDAYRRCGGHSLVRGTLHDGLKLPRAFRAAGLKTDLFDATDAATCRMYQSSREVWLGLARNAREGLAAPPLIVPMTLVLLGGQVSPLPLLILALASWPRPWPMFQVGLVAVSTLAAFLPRVIAAIRFRQSLTSVAMHPIGVVLLIAIQWFAFFRDALGRPSTWRGRAYRTSSNKNAHVCRRGLERMKR